MSLILTEAVQHSHKKKRAVEKHVQEQVDWIKAQEECSVYVEDNDLSPGNYDRQVGKAMTSQDLEKRLATVLPRNCVFVDNPYIHSKKAIQQLRDGKLETVCVYERGFMPERSVIKVKVEEFPDPDYLMRKQIMQRADLPKWEYTKGDIQFDPTAARPGFKRRKIPYGEAIRGWRTVLLRLIQSGLLSLADAERLFGAADTPNWAGHTGKQRLQLPW